MGQSYELEMKRRKLLEENAYSLRQKALQNESYDTWCIARLLRDASSMEEIKKAECQLAAIEANN